MKYRCDKIFDCEDQADEENCDYFEVDADTYNKKYPPVNRKHGIDVDVLLTVESLQNIKELDMSFDAKFTLKMEWFDSRLRYKNLIDDDYKNLLTNLVKEENKRNIWIPEILFSNTDENIKVVNGPRTILFIDKQGSHTIAPLTSLNEDFFYKGSENMLVLNVGYTLSFQCKFQLNAYPFDTQTCRIEVINLFKKIFTSLWIRGICKYVIYQCNI